MKTDNNGFLLLVKKYNIANYVNIIAVLLIITIFYLINPAFLSIKNIKNILIDIAPLLLMACGVTFVLLLGSVDLSIGAVCSCANVILVRLLPIMGFNAYLITMLFGLASGLTLGIIHTKLKIPSFIASLALMSVWSSAALLVSNSPVSVPKKLQYLIQWGKVSFGIISLTIIIAAIFVLGFYLVQSRTVMGKSIYPIGGNERVARLAGINVDTTKILVFTLSGLCSALGGIMLAAKLKSSAPTVGESFTLLVIASVALGGTSLIGGKGSIIGTILGVALVTFIQNGLNIIGVDAFWQQIAFGILVIIAVALTVDRSGRNVLIK
ncbi:MAG: ribonucleotide-diphosphate reductase subunit alpha [Clostridia bacterium]|nr:ribonucleotide-diphosphate reductase subunit alpha [Clostridia bacterium]